MVIIIHRFGTKMKILIFELARNRHTYNVPDDTLMSACLFSDCGLFTGCFWG